MTALRPRSTKPMMIDSPDPTVLDKPPAVFVCGECGHTLGEHGYCPHDGTQLKSHPEDPIIGTSIGPYRVAKLIGVGGMGRVYKGVNQTIGSRVAIKVMTGDGAHEKEYVDRFFAEARAVNLIRHENIVNIMDLDRLPGERPYIVMEYLDGLPLAEAIKQRGRLPLGSLAHLMIEVLSALDATHKKSIVHRDLKPDNVFVTPQGRAKVLDFGIAKLALDDPNSGATVEGSLIGTPHYMSPEQAQSLPADSRADLYAAGVIMFEAATGRRPFDSDSLFDLLRMHVEAPPPALRSLCPEMPPEYDQVILKAMAKTPGERYQSAHEFAEALKAASERLGPAEWEPILTERPSVDSRPLGTPPAQKLAMPLGVQSDSGAPQARQAAPAAMPTPAPKGSTKSRIWLVAAAAGVLLLAGIVSIAAFASSSGDGGDVTADDSSDPEETDSNDSSDSSDAPDTLSAPAGAALSQPRGIAVTGMRHSGGWVINFHLAERARVIEVKRDDGDYVRLGENPHDVDVNTGDARSKTYTSYSSLPDKVRFTVKYVNDKGVNKGPFVVHFSPQDMYVRSARSMLEDVPWVGFRDQQGTLLVYFTTVLVYKPALKEIRYSLDSDKLDMRVGFTPSDDPGIGSGDELFRQIPSDTKYLLMELVFRDGSTAKRRFSASDRML